MKNVTVVGAGTMGNGIAHVFAMNDFKVTLVDINDVSIEKALSTIAHNLDRLIQKEKITSEIKVNTLVNIQASTDLEKSAREADIIIEAISESEALKSKLFKDLDRLAPDDCILASNTSSISITKLGAITQRPKEVIGMHFMNPVPIMKLVEVIRGYSTSAKTVERIITLSRSLGKIPVEVHDYPGFVSNRILMPMINEAIFALFEGVAGVEQIDTVMKLGMAHPMGPLQLADFIGLDVCLAILDVLHDGFRQPKYAACPLLVNMVSAGQLGKKSGVGFYDYSSRSKNLAVAKAFR
ncbi:MAG: 3-hydroxyacyl-CoA dehydrogenase NAD-binding domain-containing protein [Saprospiraceae bacterium]|nr:3-hydroxyacyl-CoA dehydrogenase NAD-binding domain-containing protein [Saprospiraceae bacterium]